MEENNAGPVLPSDPLNPHYGTEKVVKNRPPEIQEYPWVQSDLPGYTTEEALALSLAGLDSATDQTSTLAKTQALNDLISWLKADNQRIKRLLFIRRLCGGDHDLDDSLAKRVIEGKWSDEW